MPSVAKHIRKLRLERGLTQEELAGRLHVTRQTISNWERSTSQPDLDALHSIADALGVTVAEVIYGAPPTASPALPARRRWFLIGALAAAGTALLAYLIYLLVFSNGAVGTRQAGFRYQLEEPAYSTSVYTLTQPYTVEVALEEPSESIGAVLYQDDKGCTITVSALEQVAGRWLVTFQARGTLTRLHGRLVSGCYEERSGHASGGTRVETAGGLILTTHAGGHAYTGELAELSPMEAKGNTFSFFLFPYDAGSEPDTGRVSLTVNGLIEFQTWRPWRFRG